MLPPSEDLERRRTLWEGLSDLFLDNGLDEYDFKFVASSVMKSGYNPQEVWHVLWKELFPLLELHLRTPAGHWGAFDVKWLEERVLAAVPSEFRSEQRAAARIIVRDWENVMSFLPPEFAVVAMVDPNWLKPDETNP